MNPLDSLQDALRADPVDRGSWAVYADVLLDGGDPFGELVQRALQGHSSAGVLQAARERRDPAYWPEALLSWPYEPSITWRMGLWDELELVIDSLEGEDDPTMAALHELLAHPAARLLRALRLSFSSQMDWEDHLYHLGALTSLQAPLALDLGSARFVEQDVLAQIPELVALKTWALPSSEPLERLRSLSLLGPPDRVPFARMPALHELSLSWRERPPPLDWGALPSLSHLGLLGPLPDPGRVFGQLSRQTALRSLDLEDARALLRLPPALAQGLQILSLRWASGETLRELLRFPTLRELHLTCCEPPREVLAKLRGLEVLRLDLPRELPDLRGLALHRLVLRQNPVHRDLVPRLRSMRSLRELVLLTPYDDGVLGELGRLQGLPGLAVLDLRGYHGAPEPLRWRFEGEELSAPLTARAPSRTGGGR
jgi:hypothetical protein